MQKNFEDLKKVSCQGAHPPNCQCWLCTRFRAVLFPSGVLVVGILADLFVLKEHYPEAAWLVKVFSFFFFWCRFLWLLQN
jgi:hypothetical protein